MAKKKYFFFMSAALMSSVAIILSRNSLSAIYSEIERSHSFDKNGTLTNLG